MELSNKQIDVWLIDRHVMVSPLEIQRCQSILSQDELNRARKFAFARDRERYILAKALQRNVLSRYHRSISSREWRFWFNPNGKPHIANSSAAGLHFNLSHTEGLIALAVASTQPLGVDVENTQRTNNLVSLADYCFTEAEQSYLFENGINGEDREFARRFFTLWTLKEAVVKAVGVGLSLGLKSVEFRMDDPISVGPLPQPHPQNWFLYQEWLDSHSLALACPTHHPLHVNLYRCHPLDDQYQQLRATKTRAFTANHSTVPENN